MKFRLLALVAILTSSAFAGPESLALAQKAIDLGGVKSSLEDSFMGNLEAALGQLRKTGGEELAQKVTGIARQFYNDNYKWEDLRTLYAEAYMTEYTDEELKALIAFYESPIGLKFVEKNNAISRKAALAVNAKMQDKMPALQAAMMDAVKKHLEGAQGK